MSKNTRKRSRTNQAAVSSISSSISPVNTQMTPATHTHTHTTTPAPTSSSSTASNSLAPSASSQPPAYFYEDNGWHRYDDATSAQIEAARLHRQEVVILSQGTTYGPDSPFFGRYAVYIQLMIQRNLASNYCRMVKREPALDEDDEEQGNVGFDKVIVPVKLQDVHTDDTCVICIQEFTTDAPPVRLCKCRENTHHFHDVCIRQSLTHKPQCPTCKKFYALYTGNQPTNGQMRVGYTHTLAEGHETASAGTWVINWHFPSGVQEQSHPNPGVAYANDNRMALIPDSTQGRRLLKALQKAFRRRLMFTVGQSQTTGRDNVIVWNGIHMKTGFNGPYGFPCPGFFATLENELMLKHIYLE